MSEQVPDTESARAIVRDGVLMIRIDVATLPVALRGSYDLGAIEQRFKVTDQQAFAEAVAHELNDEDEQGTTLVHRMFDSAFNAVIENGWDGVDEEPEEDDA